MPPAKSSRQSLQLIRLSFIAGVVMFGAIVTFVHRPDRAPGAIPVAVEYALVAFAILVVSVAVILRGRVGRTAEPERRAALLIVGWAIGESAALFGGVILSFTGQAQWYALGFLAMVCTFALLPIGATIPIAGESIVRESTARRP